MNDETEHQIERALGAITDARMAILATGESHEVGSEGRAPARSDRFRAAREQLHQAEQARNRLFVQLVGDAELVPLDLVKQFHLTGREAVHIVETARTGSQRMKEWILGDLQD